MSVSVHFLGVRPHQQVAGYLRHAHVGLIPFYLEECSLLIANIHPLKLYEYLVCCLTNKAPHTCETIASRAHCTLFKMSSPLAFQT